jgi:hypothetical protein
VVERALNVTPVPSFADDFLVYVGRIRTFSREDWLVYAGWVGMMTGLCVATAGVVALGHHLGAALPGEAYLVPVGAFVFALSIAIDTIGHRTIYKEEIGKGESLVHAVTIFCGVGSCVLLSMAYTYPSTLWVPAMVLTVLSFVYSMVDEVFHWRRYVRAHADRVEMSSHVGILVGHGTMMVGWWAWFFQGYRGLDTILAALAP